MNDADVEATLRAIREQARAAARAAVADRVDQGAARPVAAPPPAGERRLVSRLRRLARPVLVRAANWLTRAMLERLGPIERSLGDIRSIAAGHDQRLHQLEEEQVRLRQMVLQLDEAAQLADRSRRGALLRIEELEDRVGRQGTVPPRPPS